MTAGGRNVSAKIDHASLIAEYQRLYRESNKVDLPQIRYERGWFVIRYPGIFSFEHRYRAAEIQTMISRLAARIAEQKP